MLETPKQTILALGHKSNIKIDNYVSLTYAKLDSLKRKNSKHNRFTPHFHHIE